MLIVFKCSYFYCDMRMKFTNSYLESRRYPQLYNFFIGARVIMGCRDTNKANTAQIQIEQATSTVKKGVLVVEKLDLSSQTSIRQFAERILANEKRIDILVNNAGIMMCLEGKTEDGFETHIGTNHLGHALLTLLLLPRLMKSDSSRIVFVSSYLHSSKYLNTCIINSLALHYEDFLENTNC